LIAAFNEATLPVVPAQSAEKAAPDAADGQTAIATAIRPEAVDRKALSH
jgi:hypothetical protein